MKKSMIPPAMRKAQESEKTPAVDVTKEDDQRDWDEQPVAKRRPFEATKPEPKSEREEGQRHRQGEIHEAQQKRKTVDEGQCEEGSRRNPAMHLAGNPQRADRGQRRDEDHDQLHRGFQPE
jgi:hypothetical protein